MNLRRTNKSYFFRESSCDVGKFISQPKESHLVTNTSYFFSNVKCGGILLNKGSDAP